MHPSWKPKAARKEAFLHAFSFSFAPSTYTASATLYPCDVLANAGLMLCCNGVRCEAHFFAPRLLTELGVPWRTLADLGGPWRTCLSPWPRCPMEMLVTNPGNGHAASFASMQEKTSGPLG
jgi:hypothetical protein